MSDSDSEEPLIYELEVASLDDALPLVERENRIYLRVSLTEAQRAFNLALLQRSASSRRLKLVVSKS